MKRRILAVALTTLLPAVGMMVYNETWLRQQRYAEVRELVAGITSQTASEIDRLLEGTRSLLVAASAMVTLEGFNPADCAFVMHAIAKRVSLIDGIFVLDSKGRVICDSLGQTVGMDFSDRDFFRLAKTSNDMVVGRYRVSSRSGKPILPVALPLNAGKGFSGVIAAGIGLEWLEHRFRERGIPDGGSVTVADTDGVIIARYPYSDRFVGTRIPDAYQYLVHADAPGTTELTSQDGTTRILGYIPVDPPTHQLYVSVGLSKAEVFGPIDRASLMGLAMIGLGSVAAIAAAIVVGNRFILNPIDRIVDVLERWQRGDTTARSAMPFKTDELSVVGYSIDRLLDEIDRQRADTAKAEDARQLVTHELSHRVKNTLSVVQAIARQTFRNQLDNASADAFLKRIAALSTTHDALLAENWESGDIGEIIRRVIEPYKADHEGRIEMAGETLALPAQAALSLSLIIHELCTNAAKYGALSECTGVVRIDWQLNGSRVELSWTETGGPPPGLVAQEGFGTKLIQRAFPSMYDPRIVSDYTASGLHFSLSFSVVEADQQGQA